MMGTMPSGVDCREVLRYEGVVAGLPLEPGMLMAAVMRAKLGDGDGIRGLVNESLSNDIFAGKMQDA